MNHVAILFGILFLLFSIGGFIYESGLEPEIRYYGGPVVVMLLGLSLIFLGIYN